MSDAAPSEASLLDSFGRLADMLVKAAAILARHGHDDLNQGQVSARSPDGKWILIKHAERAFAECTRNDIIVIDSEYQRAITGLPAETPMHKAVYTRRLDVNGIVHSHAPYTVLVGAADLDLAALSHDGAWFAGTPAYRASTLPVLDDVRASEVAAVLGGADAVLLQNHGAMIVGRTIREATIGALVLERACKLQVLAAGTGLRFRQSSPDDVAAKRGYVWSTSAIRSYWESLVRQSQCEDL